MRIILGAYSKTQNPLPGYLSASSLKMRHKDKLPFEILKKMGIDEQYVNDSHNSQDNRFSIVVWNSDPDDVQSRAPESIYKKDHSVFAYSGYFHQNGFTDTNTAIKALATLDPKPFLIGVGGAAALFHYESVRHKLTISNSLTGMPQVYLYENDQVLIFGTRADQIASASSEEGNISYNPLGLVSFVLHDFYNTSELPFQNIILLDPNQLLQYEFNKRIQTDIDETINSWGLHDEDASNKAFDELTQSLLDCLTSFKSKNVPLEISLSGGKDSRIVAAGLAVLGADVRTLTVGWERGSDFIVGKQTADLLGLPKALSVVTESESPLSTKLDFSSLMVQGIAQMGALRLDRPAVPKQETKLILDPGAVGELRWKLSGTYGEVIKGGGASLDRPYVSQLPKNPTIEDVKQLVRNLMRGPVDIIRAPLFKTYCHAVDEWIEKHSVKKEPLSLLERYDLLINQFRRAAPVLPLTPSGGEYMPLADAQLLRRVSKLKRSVRTSHLAMFEMMCRLKPELETLPLSETRWGFERNTPRPGDEAGYEARKPVKVDHNASESIYPYYTIPTDMRRFMEIEFNSSVGQAAFEIIDHEKWRKIWHSPHSLQEATSYWMLNVYGAGLIMSGTWKKFDPMHFDSEKQILLRLDKPWARFHNWIFHSLQSHALTQEIDSNQNVKRKIYMGMKATLASLLFLKSITKLSRKVDTRILVYAKDMRKAVLRNAQHMGISEQAALQECASIRSEICKRPYSIEELIDPVKALDICMFVASQKKITTPNKVIKLYVDLFHFAYGFQYTLSGKQLNISNN